MDINILLLAALIVILSSTTQALTGFGFNMVAIPFMVLIFDPRAAVALTLMMAFVLSSVLFFSIRRDTNWQLLKKVLGAAFIGLPLGLLLFYFIDVAALKIYANAVILILSILSLNNYSLDITKNIEVWKWLSGGISGFLSGSVGMPGPPVILFLSSLNIKKEEFRATIIAYFLVIYPLSFFSMIAMGSVPVAIFKTAAFLAPFTLIGMFMGKALFNRVSDRVFKKIVLIVLIIVASYSIVVNLF